MIIWLPLLFSLLFLTMQGALYHYGRSAALTIANAGVRASAVEHGTVAACRAAASSMAAKVGDALTGITIQCSRSGNAATATVTGSTLSVIPFVVPTTRQSSSLPVERLS